MRIKHVMTYSLVLLIGGIWDASVLLASHTPLHAQQEEQLRASERARVQQELERVQRELAAAQQRQREEQLRAQQQMQQAEAQRRAQQAAQQQVLEEQRRAAERARIQQELERVQRELAAAQQRQREEQSRAAQRPLTLIQPSTLPVGPKSPAPRPTSPATALPSVSALRPLTPMPQSTPSVVIAMPPRPTPPAAPLSVPSISMPISQPTPRQPVTSLPSVSALRPLTPMPQSTPAVVIATPATRPTTPVAPLSVPSIAMPIPQPTPRQPVTSLPSVSSLPALTPMPQSTPSVVIATPAPRSNPPAVPLSVPTIAMPIPQPTPGQPAPVLRPPAAASTAPLPMPQSTASSTSALPGASPQLTPSQAAQLGEIHRGIQKAEGSLELLKQRAAAEKAAGRALEFIPGTAAPVMRPQDRQGASSGSGMPSPQSTPISGALSAPASRPIGPALTQIPGSQKLPTSTSIAPGVKPAIISPVGSATVGIGKASSSAQGEATTRVSANPEEIAQMRAKLERLKNRVVQNSRDGLPDLDVAPRPFDFKVPLVAGSDMLASGADARMNATREIGMARKALESGDMEGARQHYKEAQLQANSAEQSVSKALELNDKKETNITRCEQLCFWNARYGNWVGIGATGGDYGNAQPIDQRDGFGKAHDERGTEGGFGWRDVKSPKKWESDAQFFREMVTTKSGDWKESVFKVGVVPVFAVLTGVDTIFVAGSEGTRLIGHTGEVIGSKAKEKWTRWIGGGSPQAEVLRSDMAGTTPAAILRQDQSKK